MIKRGDMDQGGGIRLDLLGKRWSLPPSLFSPPDKPVTVSSSRKEELF